MYRTEIIVNDLSLLSGKEEGGSYSRSTASFDQSQPSGADDFAQNTAIGDDDIPF